MKYVLVALALCCAVSTYAYISFQNLFMEATVTETAYRADRLFHAEDPNYDANIHKLAQQIEWGEAIAPQDIQWLGSRVNERHGQDITLLFHALASGNVAAVDALLAVGADPTMPDKTGSRRDFVYALTMPGGDLLDQDAMNDIIRAYLAHGGDPNGSGGLDAQGRPLPGIRTVLPYGLALNGNYQGLEIVLAAGADPWLPEFNDGEYFMNAVDALASDQQFEQLDMLIDKGYFDHRTQTQLEHFLNALGGYAQRRDEPSLEIKRIAMRVLKRNPHYIETVTHDARTRMIFKDHWNDPEPGQIPWDEIRSDRVN